MSQLSANSQNQEESSLQSGCDVSQQIDQASVQLSTYFQYNEDGTKVCKNVQLRRCIDTKIVRKGTYQKKTSSHNLWEHAKKCHKLNLDKVVKEKGLSFKPKMGQTLMYEKLLHWIVSDQVRDYISKMIRTLLA